MSNSGKELTALSKCLSWLLRHGAVKEGLNLDEEGYALVADILRLPQFRPYSLADIELVVANDAKLRYSLKRDEMGVKLRANQGHSIAIDDQKVLRPIGDCTPFDCVIHGTYDKNWPSIERNGLSRMSRRHIHFARGKPNDERVISGVRANVEILVYVDIERAVNDGIKFYISTNDVILSPGNDEGILETKYFKEVWRVRPTEQRLL